MPSIISENDLLKEQLTQRLVDVMPNIEKSVLDEVFKILDNLDTSNGEFITGPLTLDKLLEFSTAIDKALSTSRYGESVNLFISDFGKVTINSSTFQKS